MKIIVDVSEKEARQLLPHIQVTLTALFSEKEHQLVIENIDEGYLVRFKESE